MSVIGSLRNEHFTLALGGDYSPLPLKHYIQLIKIRGELFEALEKRNQSVFLARVREIIQLQTEQPLDETRFPTEILVSLLQILSENRAPDELVFLKKSPVDDENKPDVWGYDDRIFIQWIDIVANRYHWSLKEILDTNFKTILYFIQECLIHRQLDREWEYSLSELAYRYDQNTKQSRFEPLKRPFWMNEGTFAELPEKTKIPVSMLPKGKIINVSGMELQSGNPDEESSANTS